MTFKFREGQVEGIRRVLSRINFYLMCISVKDTLDKSVQNIFTFLLILITYHDKMVYVI